MSNDIVENAVITDKTYTLIIFSDFQELPKFYVVEGDYRHLDKIVINVNSNDAELNDLLYTETGEVKHKEYDNLQSALQFIGLIPFGCINCGFAP